MSFPQQIASQITTSPQVIQFAKDGKYEEAWIVNLDEKQPAKDEVQDYVNEGEYKKLIVEYIWNPDMDEERYVLTVIQDKGCQEQDRFEFVRKCFKIFYDQLNFSDLIRQIDQQIIGKEFLLQHLVQRVRLGVFNHWFSVGPIELWDEGEKLDPAVIEQKIKDRPEVEKSKLNYQGLAFIYNFDGSLPGPYHVFKTPCCYRQEDEWVVDTDLVNENLKKMVEGHWNA